MEVIFITLAVALASHMGLCLAIAKRIRVLGTTVRNIVKCPKCLTFWLTLPIISVSEASFAASVMVSLICAYSVQWIVLLLEILNVKYINIWQRRIPR